MSVAVCSTQRTTLLQTQTFVQYYLKLGASKIFIFFDDPHDPNIIEIQHIENVISVLCDEQYWQKHGERPDSIEKRQRINSDHAVALCLEHNINWLLHVDVDEFIHFKDTSNISHYFHKIAENIPTIRFPVCESIPFKEEHDDFLSDITHFRCHPISYQNAMKMRLNLKLKMKFDLISVKIKLFFLNLMGLKRYSKYNFMKAYTSGKSASRVSSNIDQMGLHTSKINYKEDEFSTVAQDAEILHYDAFSYQAWVQKWRKRIDGTGRSTWMHSERNQQLIDFKELYDSSDEEALKELYHEIYFIDEKDIPILKLLGLVKTVFPN